MDDDNVRSAKREKFNDFLMTRLGKRVSCVLKNGQIAEGELVALHFTHLNCIIRMADTKFHVIRGDAIQEIIL